MNSTLLAIFAVLVALIVSAWNPAAAGAAYKYNCKPHPPRRKWLNEDANVNKDKCVCPKEQMEEVPKSEYAKKWQDKKGDVHYCQSQIHMEKCKDGMNALYTCKGKKPGDAPKLVKICPDGCQAVLTNNDKNEGIAYIYCLNRNIKPEELPYLSTMRLSNPPEDDGNYHATLKRAN